MKNRSRMPYKRRLRCRQAFGIKSKIGKTQANRFCHIFLTHKISIVVTSSVPETPRSWLLRLSPKRRPRNAAAPKLVYASDPEFPSRQGAGGVVVVSCVVDANGLPKQVTLSRSLSRAFDKNAVHAVKQYRFEPASFEGTAVPVKVNIEVNFKRY
jgi:TonB family protein